MPVAREEFLNAESIGGMAGADECCIAKALRQQFHAPKNEGAHQDLAQLRVRLHQGKEIFAGDLDDLPILPCTHAYHCTTPRKNVDFTGELTSPHNQKKRLGCACRPHTLQFACDDDKKWSGPVPFVRLRPRLRERCASCRAWQHVRFAPTSTLERSARNEKRSAEVECSLRPYLSILFPARSGS